MCLTWITKIWRKSTVQAKEISETARIIHTKKCWNFYKCVIGTTKMNLTKNQKAVKKNINKESRMSASSEDEYNQTVH